MSKEEPERARSLKDWALIIVVLSVLLGVSVYLIWLFESIRPRDRFPPGIFESCVIGHTWGFDNASITLSVKNTGMSSLSVASVQVNGATVAESNVAYDGSFTGVAHTLDPGESGTIIITHTFISGIRYEFAVISATGNKFTYIPTIYIRLVGTVEGTDKIQRNGDVYTFIDNIYYPVVVERNNIVVDGAGYTLEGTGSGTGIELHGRSNIRIRNAEIKEFLFGIELRKSSNIIIQGNNITNNGSGISLSNSNDNHIYENNITSQNFFGITLSTSNYNSISGNCIADNYQLGIGCMSSSYNSISGNSIRDNTCGIELISAVSGPNMHPSSYNSISGNNVTANHVDGIRLQASPNNSMVGNTIRGNGVGIRCSGSSNNSASGNNVASNSAGMQFLHCCDNSVSENTIRDNKFGISISMNSSNNRFYRNNFVNNTAQVHFLFSDYANVWDDGYPSGGNYWSDHVTVDDYSGVNQDELGSDGIVDEPYIIDADNRDNYPLAQPWSVIIPATLDIDPDALNLKSQGPWITAYVELPQAYDVNARICALILKTILRWA